MSHTEIQPEPEISAQNGGEGRDLVLSGVVLPPSEAPPLLHAHLAPRRAPADLDLPACMPTKRRPELKFEDDTETMLNEMIGDCQFLMREVAYRCIAQASDPADRLEFLGHALNCAVVGTKIADSIARLRAAPLDEDRKLAIVLETNRLQGDPAGKSVKQ
ncbi:MAG TPA: hypothetical protein VHZ78_09365 [Rhizomicrobium sp.]|jgi:hypothetical protein|nr:hypothetical protein [Rhizomicrobium sp.]